nr:unnamed protein product [Callosobruchus analis]
MRWWLNHLRASSDIFPRSPEVFMSSDASEKGWGAQIGEKLLSGLWTGKQLKWHINIKEMMAIFLSVRLCSDMLRGKTVVVQSDNQTVVSYIRKQGGTKSRLLTNVVSRLLKFCKEQGIALIPQFLPGRLNSIADCLSRGKRLVVWKLSKSLVRRIFQRWGTPEIDLCIEAFQGSEGICLERHDGSGSRLYGCVQSSLEFQSCLDFPTASLDPQSPLPPQLRPGGLHFGGATMGEGLLETRSEEQSHCSSHQDSQCKSPPAGKPDGQASPAISQNIFGGMENTWWASTTKNWPEEDRSLLERAWRKSTLRTYSSPWKQWLAWCARIKSNPVQPEHQAIATRNYKKYVMKDPSMTDDSCRKCQQQKETIEHITSTCKTFAGTEHTARHNTAAKVIYQALATTNKLMENKDPYYSYTPTSVFENNQYKLYWDVEIRTDKTIPANRPDIVLQSKADRVTYLIDTAIPNDKNIQDTYAGKISKYTDMAIETKRLFKQSKVIIVPLIMSVSGLTPNTFTPHLQQLGLDESLHKTFQKSVILKTCSIKLYWDVEIRTDKTIPANRPDIVLQSKADRVTYLIDITVPNDKNIQDTYAGKISKYTDNAIEIKLLWKQNKVIIVPLIMSVSGLTPNTFTPHLK